MAGCPSFGPSCLGCMPLLLTQTGTAHSYRFSASIQKTNNNTQQQNQLAQRLAAASAPLRRAIGCGPLQHAAACIPLQRATACVPLHLAIACTPLLQHALYLLQSRLGRGPQRGVVGQAALDQVLWWVGV